LLKNQSVSQPPFLFIVTHPWLTQQFLVFYSMNCINNIHKHKQSVIHQAAEKSLIFFLITIIFVSPSTLFAIKEYTAKTMTLQERTASIRIEYEPKRKKIAEYYLNKAILYIPAMEKYLESPFPVDDITIWLDEKPGHAYKYSNGVKLVRHHLSKKFPAVLFHEFGHFYYSSWTDKWLVEGINSFLPIAIAEYGLLSKNDAAYDSVMRTWGFYSTGTTNDRPVMIDFRRTVWHFYYSKTFKIQYLIYKELGKEKYRQFVQDVALQMRYFLDYSHLTTIRLLKKYKMMNWKRFLSGWVYEGDYDRFSFNDFKDNNKNGLPDIIDFYEKNPSGMPLHYGQYQTRDSFWIDYKE
jgi:hypothetical protein